ncbi:MAG: hypothetical protein JXQ75_22500 [Phycisphaerae bacterium]|nr:hypothetical protein [Phycisphaerae bacterium]
MLFVAILGLSVAEGLMHSVLYGQWFIIPGGLVVRKFSFRSLSTKLHRFTPADTILLIRSASPGWQAGLWEKGRARASMKNRSLTAFEYTALLGAWQSPLPPPPRDQLVDFE